MLEEDSMFLYQSAKKPYEGNELLINVKLMSVYLYFTIN